MTGRAALGVAILLGLGGIAEAADPAPPLASLREIAPREAAEALAVVAMQPGMAEVVHTERAPRTVIVGDPAIAEATVTNERTVLLIARAAGATNLILLDENGNEFYRSIVQVGTPPRSITVYGASRTDGRETVVRYSCDQTCIVPTEPPPQATINYTINGAPAGGGDGTVPPETAPGGTTPGNSQMIPIPSGPPRRGGPAGS